MYAQYRDSIGSLQLASLLLRNGVYNLEFNQYPGSMSWASFNPRTMRLLKIKPLFASLLLLSGV